MLMLFQEVTDHVPLRMQLLTACLQFLQPGWAKAASLGSKDGLQACILLLVVQMLLCCIILLEL